MTANDHVGSFLESLPVLLASSFLVHFAPIIFLFMCRVRTRANNFIPCNRDTKPLMSLFLTRYRSENVCNVTTRTIEITPAPSRHTGQTVVWLHGPQRRTENDEKRNSMALRLYGVCAVSALGHERGATADRSSYYAAATHSNFSPTRTLPLIQ